MRLSTAIRDYLTEIEVRRYTPKTIRGYRNNLGFFLPDIANGPTRIRWGRLQRKRGMRGSQSKMEPIVATYKLSMVTLPVAKRSIPWESGSSV